MSSENTSLAVIRQDPATFMQFIDTVGTAFAQGGLPGCKGAGQGKALALTCLMEGLTPLQFMLQFHLLDGKPTKQATTLLAEFEAAGGETTWQDLGDSGKEAKARWKYKHHDLVISYTKAEAEAQVGGKLNKEGSNYKKNIGSMLRARLITKALRIVCPAVIAGIYTPEELGHDEYNIETSTQPIDVDYTVTPTPQAEEESCNTSTSQKKNQDSTGSSRNSKKKETKTKSKTKTKSELPTGETSPSTTTSKQTPSKQLSEDEQLEARGKELMATNDAVKQEEQDVAAQTNSAANTTTLPTTTPNSDTESTTVNANATSPEEEDVTDVGRPKALCTQSQLDKLKQLIIDLDFKDKFDAALEKIEVAGAKNLTLDQAEKWINRLEEIKAAT